MQALPAGHPVTRLVGLEVAFLQGGAVAAEAHALAREHEGWGAAWGLVALAAEREDRIEEAAVAARKAAALLPGKDWDTMAARLEKSLSERLLEQATALLQNGDAAGALAAATALLTSDPGLAPARFLATRAQLALGNVSGAAGMVPALPDTPEGLELKGQVAERLGQWDLAVQLYGRLPASNPRRCELLKAARDQWRLANAPPYVTRALGAGKLNRRGLAVLLVWKAPGLADRATGAVPVFEDIVSLSERSDLIIAARTGLMPGDQVTRHFGAERTVSPRELTLVLGRLASLVGRPQPSWCNDVPAEGCLPVPQVVDGATTAALLDEVLGLEEPCRS